MRKVKEHGEHSLSQFTIVVTETSEEVHTSFMMVNIVKFTKTIPVRRFCFYWDGGTDI